MRRFRPPSTSACRPAPGPAAPLATYPAGQAPAYKPLGQAIIAQLALQTELAAVVLPVVLQNLAVLDRKQLDYGSINLTKFGVEGVIVRMNDKLERVITLSRRQRAQVAAAPGTAVHFEPLSDSLLDLANYALIAYVMERHLWPLPRD